MALLDWIIKESKFVWPVCQEKVNKIMSLILTSGRLRDKVSTFVKVVNHVSMKRLNQIESIPSETLQDQQLETTVNFSPTFMI